MWIEELPSGKYKYNERYKDPYTEKYRRVSITLTSKSNQAKKKAMMELQSKIDSNRNKPKEKSITFSVAMNSFIPNYEKKVKTSSFLSFKSTEKTIVSMVGADTLIKNIDTPFLKKSWKICIINNNTLSIT